MMRKTILLLGIIILFSLAGCGQDGENNASSQNTPIAAVPSAAPTLVGDESDVVVAQDASDATSIKFILKVWVPAAFSLTDGTTGADVLNRQFAAFDGSHPDVEFDIQPKSVAEQGGIFSYLRTGRTVAPDVLPDLVLIPSDQLGSAVRDGLVMPLDDLLSVEGLYPAAADLGRSNGVLYGYPYGITELYHLLVNGNRVETPLPGTWDAFLQTENLQLAFAGTGRGSATMALQLYLSSGGTLETADGALTLQESPLSKAFSRIQVADTAGVLLPRVLEISLEEEVWSAWQRGDSTVALVNAPTYLAKRVQGIQGAFSALPGASESSDPLIAGWVWAITTPDPARQALSAELITHLTQPANLGEWSSAVLLLPTHPEAFDRWPADPYTLFLKQRLVTAIAYPVAADLLFMSTLNTAIVDMLINDTPPPVAAQNALKTLAERTAP